MNKYFKNIDLINDTINLLETDKKQKLVNKYVERPLQIFLDRFFNYVRWEVFRDRLSNLVDLIEINRNYFYGYEVEINYNLFQDFIKFSDPNLNDPSPELLNAVVNELSKLFEDVTTAVYEGWLYCIGNVNELEQYYRDEFFGGRAEIKAFLDKNKDFITYQLNPENIFKSNFEDNVKCIYGTYYHIDQDELNNYNGIPVYEEF